MIEYAAPELIVQVISLLSLFFIIAFPDVGTGQEATNAAVPSVVLPFSKSSLVGTKPVLA